MRILIISYYFPPLNTIASHRPYSWARTWSTLGHEVHVLTTAKHTFHGALDLDYDLSGLRIHTAPFLGKVTSATGVADSSDRAATTARRWERFKYLTRRLRLSCGMFADIASLGYFSLLKTGLTVLRSKEFDFIVSTSPPEVSHFVAHELSVRTGVPWVADYRDLWFPEMGVHHSRWAATLTGLASRRMLKQATVISTVSQGLAARLKAFTGREIHVCYNGYFTDADSQGDRPWTDDKIHIAYTGRIYPHKRDPSMFFKALGQALASKTDLVDRLVVDIYSNDEPWLNRLISHSPAASCVRVHALVPHKTSLAIQQHAAYLLFIDWMDKRADGILTGKLFEYLASGRPILCVGNRENSEAAEMIRKTRAGVVLTATHTIRDFLETLPDHLAVGPALRDQIKPYSREEQAARFLDSMREATGSVSS
jgi:glycosyltransferase involved in cell wall biosynthesis